MTALFDPDDSCEAAVAAPVPCLNPFGGRSQGGVLPVAFSRSSTFILAVAAAETFNEFWLLLLLLLALVAPLLTPDDLTLFVDATRSRNRRSNLERKEWIEV